MKKPPLIVITGPTAVGKTGLSIALAKALKGEIISADSMQVYRGMDIGTAKIKEQEMENIPHHLIDILDPSENFDVACFQQRARAAIEEIYQRGHMPIIVGGTAFYIQALLYGIDFTEEEHDKEYRQSLMETAKTETGKKQLYEKLCAVDPEYAGTVHYNNAKRVVRALEYCHYTNKLFSEYNQNQRRKQAEYNFKYYVLTDERELLYQRINERVDMMVKEGLPAEAASLYDRKLPRNYTSMQGVGYREIFEYLDGRCTLEDAIENIKKNTRHFAKRQLTWFRKEENVIWIDKKSFDRDDKKILEFIINETKELLDEKDS